MSGFSKIDFGQNTVQKDKAVKSTDTNPIMPAKKKRKVKFSFGKKTKIITIILVVIVVLLTLIAIPAYATYKSGLKAYREAKILAAVAKSQNIDLTADEIVKTKKDLQETQKNLHVLFLLKF